jgi:hypothetical protein
MTALSGKPASVGNETRPDIAAYNDVARALDALIYAPVMCSTYSLIYIGAEDRRWIAEIRSVLVDAEASLLRDDHPNECRLGLLAAVDKLDWLLKGRKRTVAYNNPQRGLDSRVRNDLETIRGGAAHLANTLSGFAKRSPRDS